MNLAAHELLETSEALRSKAAEIEQHGMYASQCRDQRLKSILIKHQQQMMNAYQQGVNIAQGKGAQLTHQAPNFHTQNMNPNAHHQVTMSAPMMNTQTLSDQTIATLALNTHKSGSMMGMQWANECVDPQLRMYHVNGANMCQEMAYEIWSWMNQNGYYQPQSFNTMQTAQMTGMFQPAMDTNQNMGQTTSMHNPNPMQ
jgi:spore coat protein CotF